MLATWTHAQVGAVTLIARQTLLQFRDLEQMPDVDQSRKFSDERDMFRDVAAEFAKLGVLVDETVFAQTSESGVSRLLTALDGNERGVRLTASYLRRSRSCSPERLQIESSSLARTPRDVLRGRQSCRTSCWRKRDLAPATRQSPIDCVRV